MGYTLTIGEAIVHPPEWEDYSGGETIDCRIEAKGEARDDAPTFANDSLTANTNERSPSYTVWSNFCEAVGLYKLFYGKDKSDGYRSYDGLLAHHPGAALLGPEQALDVRQALERYRLAHPEANPGFEAWELDKNPDPTPENVDPTLARLIWLDYWVTWAVENCEHAILENT